MIKFQIVNKDRIGLVYDISQVFAQMHINIVHLEVMPDIMHLEISSEADIDQEVLFSRLKAVKGVMACKNIDLLPSEKTNRQLTAVLDAINEGVMAINSEGEVTTVNPMVEKIFNRDKDRLFGEKITSLIEDNQPILTCLQSGQPYNHQEVFIKKGDTHNNFFTSGRPIKDTQGHVRGVVITLKDMREVRDFFYSVTKPADITFDEIVGKSSKIQSIIHLCKRFALSNSTILLRGESGTGKELFARSIHMASKRKNKPFVPVNLASLPDSLLESELFGYTGGSFTGAAKSGRPGLFEFANEGTIFLDEIGEMLPNLQVKLLRVLQEGKVKRVGSQMEKPVDVRVIAATNSDLEALIKENKFREDLYYRLNVIPIYLPPLRNRKEDIPLLAMYFIRSMSAKLDKKVESVTSQAMEKLCSYEWPGNIRELENVIERAVNLATEPYLTEDLIHLKDKIHQPERLPGRVPRGGFPAKHGFPVRKGSLKERPEKGPIHQADGPLPGNLPYGPHEQAEKIQA
jgi:PAS domain S-box-containing protein